MITLFQDKVLIRPIKEESLSSIAMPEDYVDYYPFKAEVLNVGPGHTAMTIEMDSEKNVKEFRIKGGSKAICKKGDIAVVERNKDYPLKINGEWLMIVKESNIIGIVDEPQD